MRKINFNSLPTDYQEVILAFKKHIEYCEKDLEDYEHRHYNEIREEAMIYCLRHAIDLAKGCFAAAEARLPSSLTTLSRALLETMVWARYITISGENAQEFIDSRLNELKRIARDNLSAGFAKVFGIDTKEDKTGEFLASPITKDIPKRISIKKAAEKGGLVRLYTTVYGFLSMTSHGRAFNKNSKDKIDTELYSSLCVALGMLEGIELITSDWISKRKQTSIKVLARILGVPVKAYSA